MNNYLVHRNHKYIKREKINGKWRYWYDYSFTGKGYKKDINAIRKEYESDENELGRLTGKYSTYLNMLKDGKIPAHKDEYGRYIMPTSGERLAYEHGKAFDKVYGRKETEARIKKIDNLRYSYSHATIPTLIRNVTNTYQKIVDLPGDLIDSGKQAVKQKLAVTVYDLYNAGKQIKSK